MTAFPRVSSILCLFDGRELNTLDMAFGLARRHAACLRVLHLFAPPMRVVDPFGAAAYAGAIVSSQVIDQLVKDEDATTAVAQRAVQDAATRHGVQLYTTETGLAVSPGAAAVFVADQDFPEHAIALYGGISDLIIAGRGHAGKSGDGYSFSTLLDTGRPLLLVTEDTRAPGQNAMPRRVLVAWDGSHHVARALESALPLLADASAVDVVTVGETNEAEAARRNRAAAVQRLNGLGLHVTASDIGADGDIGQTLLAKARDLDADMMIVGAYGHNRLREALFGGVSHYLLHHAGPPILMCH